MESEGPNNISEYEKWVKLMVKKQTEKSISFERQFEQHKHFVAVDNQFTVPESFKGFHTLPELQLAQITQDELNKYKLAGLSETEIELYLQYQKNKEAAMGSTTTVKLSNMEMEPTVFMGKIEEIKLKLKQFIQSQEGEQASFTGILKDPFYHVAQLAEKIDYNKQVNRKKIAKRHHENYKFPSANETKTENTTENKTIDSSLLQVAVPLEEEDILQNRLSLDEIKEMAKFRKYTPGIPSNVGT